MKQQKKNQYSNVLEKLKENYGLKCVDADAVVNFIKNNFSEYIFLC